MLLIGIQNSTKKARVYMFNFNSINLPISFIIGINFISGSLIGSTFSITKKKDKVSEGY